MQMDYPLGSGMPVPLVFLIVLSILWFLALRWATACHPKTVVSRYEYKTIHDIKEIVIITPRVNFADLPMIVEAAIVFFWQLFFLRNAGIAFIHRPLHKNTT